ncbi:MAG: PhzF family phenazine biosynthesis protein [Acidimicrobiales bacterium]|nr:PhzF family phenazine biosynthesis protein [Acidimicrobiales bacterium]
MLRDGGTDPPRARPGCAGSDRIRSGRPARLSSDRGSIPDASAGTPGIGIAEDAATGAAAAAACGYLAGHASRERLDEGWVIEQGVEMGRPSRIEVGAVVREAELSAATVGGAAVRVGRGELDLV